jgi:hypothetical protein
MSAPEREPSSSEQMARLGRGLTLLVTNAIKLGGLWIAVHEIATQAQPRLTVLAVALFMMSGAQASEEAVLKLAGRVFGSHAEPHNGPAP